MCVIFTLRKTQFGGKSPCVTARISRGCLGGGGWQPGRGARVGSEPCLWLLLPLPLDLVPVSSLWATLAYPTGVSCAPEPPCCGGETRAPRKSIVEGLPRDDTNAEGARAPAGAGVRVQDRQGLRKPWGRGGCTAGAVSWGRSRDQDRRGRGRGKGGGGSVGRGTVGLLCVGHWASSMCISASPYYGGIGGPEREIHVCKTAQLVRGCARGLSDTKPQLSALSYAVPAEQRGCPGGPPGMRRAGLGQRGEGGGPELGAEGADLASPGLPGSWRGHAHQNTWSLVTRSCRRVHFFPRSDDT